MNPPKCDELDYINFLIAAQQVFSTVEAAKTSPDERAPAHDAYTRLLQRLPPDSAALWSEVEALVQRQQGVLVIDDSCQITDESASVYGPKWSTSKHRTHCSNATITN